MGFNGLIAFWNNGLELNWQFLPSFIALFELFRCADEEWNERLVEMMEEWNERMVETIEEWNERLVVTMEEWNERLVEMMEDGNERLVKTMEDWRELFAVKKEDEKELFVMHKYAFWSVYLFGFSLSPNDTLKVPKWRCQRGSLTASKVSVSAMQPFF